MSKLKDKGDKMDLTITGKLIRMDKNGLMMVVHGGFANPGTILRLKNEVGSTEEWLQILQITGKDNDQMLAGKKLFNRNFTFTIQN